MVSARFNTKKLDKVLKNAIKYSQGFALEMKKQEPVLAAKLAETSIAGFYEYLDALARTNPSMLHHIYEWGEVGNPSARLVELKKILGGDKAEITSEFLESTSISEGSNESFYNKAEVMEEGIPVTIQEVNAQALFFIADGQEFFRMGPITIENPGGAAVRGSFVRAFEEFYNVYFDRVYLEVIRFYQHFENPTGYEKNFNSAVTGGSPESVGRRVAMSWVLQAPGDNYE